MNSILDDHAPLAFGISATTGRPLNALTDDVIQAMLSREKEASTESLALTGRTEPSGVEFAVEGGIDANDLTQAGWGVIYAPGVDQSIKDALSPLLERRNAQAEPFKVFDGPDGFLPGDTAGGWLARHNVRMDVVDPAQGVPFYLLLVGPPDALPFEFQYTLDIYWAVGRLWFDRPEQFRQYADSVVAYETGTSVPTSRRAAVFATEHDFDAATQAFMYKVAQPLSAGDGSRPTVWQRQKFALDTYLGDQATKSALQGLMRGDGHGTPALLFSGTHGMQFDPEDDRQIGAQGAVVCQDWGGLGTITADQWFAGADVPQDARLHGMMHFFFACHGGGCPEFDNYDRLNNAPKRIASKPFFSRLPQEMLAHAQGGALASLAHIERAWAYSFQGQRGGAQIQGFRDVIGRLLRGERIGQATDTFNVRWAAIAADLSDAQSDLQRGANVALRTVGNLWVARDDARNFMILGDPAVRLRVEDMPPS